LTPAFHGFYRAIISTSFNWSVTQWRHFSTQFKALCAPDVIDRLNHLLVDIFQQEDADPEVLRFTQTFVSRYVSHGRPLSGYFVVCCVLEAQWTALAQALSPSQTIPYGNIIEAAAANQAWLSLMRCAGRDLDIADRETREVLKSTIGYAMQCFTDLLIQIEEMDSEPSLDTYAWETMSESLVRRVLHFCGVYMLITSIQKLASVCSVALRDIDEKLYSRLLLLLSDESPISDNLVQEAALKATTVLVQKSAQCSGTWLVTPDVDVVFSFPDIAPAMASHLRRFVTAPLPIFEFEFASETRAPPPLAAAAKCLALCIKVCRLLHYFYSC
jgi:phosphatidylinositol 4-kinase